ncbi:MAG: cbb3-type cytochrome c oxidase subunit 3 [Oceanobacter sp.]
MDINDVRGLSTLVALTAFISIIWWAYGSNRKKRFEEDAEIPFLDNDDQPVDDEKDRSK